MNRAKGKCSGAGEEEEAKGDTRARDEPGLKGGKVTAGLIEIKESSGAERMCRNMQIS